MEEKLLTIGKSEQRLDGWDKVTGAATYTDDIDFGPGLLYAAMIESPHAHALIKKLDVSKAQAVDGVVKVITGADFPYKFGLYMFDRFIFAQDRVRFVGEPLGAVIAWTPQAALKAAKLVEAQYEMLPPVFDQISALEPNSALVHPGHDKYWHVPWFFPKANTNIAHWRKIRKGDMDAGFKSADLVLEDTYHVPRYAHCAIEMHCATAMVDQAGRLTVWAASQSPYTQRNLFAQSLAPLGFSHHTVRVVTPYVGGGFGGKAGATMEMLAAALATSVKGHPVKVLWNRAQEFYATSQRQGLVNKVKLGVKKDGSITALENTMYWDCGAYAEYGANVVNAAGLSATNPYKIDNVKIDSICIYTNLPPCAAYRGFGYSEFGFGLESQITRAAKALNISPVEFRRKNAISGGDKMPYGASMNANGLRECIDYVSGEIKPHEKLEHPDKRKVYGKSLVCYWKAPAMPPNAASSAFIKFNEDASINVLVSGMEIGQGLLTVMGQIASEVLTVPMSKIRVELPDTDRNPYEWQTVGSHVTWGCGNAVKLAAEDARNQIFEIVCRVHGFNKEDLYLKESTVFNRAKPDFKQPLKDFVIYGIQAKDFTFKGGPIMGRGMFMPEFASAITDPETGQGGKPNVHYTTGAAGAILEIDKQTGKMKLKKIAFAADVGKAINPDLIRGQITGGLVQGLATVLYEDMRYDAKGKLINASFADYKIPTTLDIPEEIASKCIEVGQPDGPFGARGVGEHTMIPVASMIADAIEDSLGIRITSLPLTSEKVALAIAGIKPKPAQPPVPQSAQTAQPKPHEKAKPARKKTLAVARHKISGK
jgi:carbon-monoxide dehydrogenase large subunit